MNSAQMNARELLLQFQIKDADLALIRRFKIQQQVNVQQLIADFYDWLEDQVWYKQYFSAGVPPSVQSLQCEYWQSFLDAKVDDAYVKQRVTVGRVHATINLPVTAYLAGMNFAQNWYAALVSRQAGDVQECVALLGAINKLIQLDSTIVMHVYSLQSMDAVFRQGEITRSIVSEATRVVKSAATGDFNTTYQRQDESDALERPINQMIANLKRISQENEKEKWFKSGIADLSVEIRGGLPINSLSDKAIRFLAQYLDAQVGVLYVVEEDDALSFRASYACGQNKPLRCTIKSGVGLIGQAFKERKRIVIKEVPDDYITISSGLGEHVPSNLVIQPLVYNGDVKGIIELGSFNYFSETQLEFLEKVGESIAVAINSSLDQDKMQRLLLVEQQTSEKLQLQQSELETANKTLGEQAQALKASEEKLTTQRDMLEASNRELQLKTDDLERQKVQMEAARQELEEKAMQLANSSRYKSEFLANMSHELRTPLNSLLLLSQSLIANKGANLSDEQIEDLRVIYSGGNSLLTLINDILDLSKVEAGKMQSVREEVDISRLANRIREQFNLLAKQKNLEFNIDIGDVLDIRFESDQLRIEQILRNLLSNAFKFTHEGGVNLRIGRLTEKPDCASENLAQDPCIAFCVSDTGIGIAAKNQASIFEAFQQADGSTSRAYGGTGLGLTISRELAALLGGEIRMQSHEGEGSEFMLTIPLQEPEEAQPREVEAQSSVQHSSLADAPLPTVLDHGMELDGVAGRKILLVDDDIRNVYALSRALKEAGFTIALADNGLLAIEKLKKECDVDLVLMDIMMPVMDGYQAMREIRQNISESIPIIALTAKAMSNDKTKCIEAGATDYMSKPVNINDLLSMVKTWCYH